MRLPWALYRAGRTRQDATERLNLTDAVVRRRHAGILGLLQEDRAAQTTTGSSPPARRLPGASIAHSSARVSCTNEIAPGNGHQQQRQAGGSQGCRRVEADKGPVHDGLLGGKDVRSFAVVEHPGAQAFQHLDRAYEAPPADQGRDNEGRYRL